MQFHCFFLFFFLSTLMVLTELKPLQNNIFRCMDAFLLIVLYICYWNIKSSFASRRYLKTILYSNEWRNRTWNIGKIGLWKDITAMHGMGWDRKQTHIPKYMGFGPPSHVFIYQALQLSQGSPHFVFLS